MNKFYKIKFEPNKSYTIKLCSLEKKYVYYRNNFQRVCYENYKLKQEIEKLEDKMIEQESGQVEVKNMTKMEKELIEKLEKACQTEARVTLRLVRKLQVENKQLKEKIKEYEIGKKQE